jgi:hypothetical protein
MLRHIRGYGLAAAVALGVAVFALNQQGLAQTRKKDVRMEKGTMPGGVTLFGTDKVSPVLEGRELATFGGG